MDPVVESSFMDKIHSVVRNIGQFAHRVAPMAKNMMTMSGNPYAQAGAAALGALGYGHKTLENRVAS